MLEVKQSKQGLKFDHPCVFLPNTLSTHSQYRLCINILIVSKCNQVKFLLPHSFRLSQNFYIMVLVLYDYAYYIIIICYAFYTYDNILSILLYKTIMGIRLGACHKRHDGKRGRICQRFIDQDVLCGKTILYCDTM